MTELYISKRESRPRRRSRSSSICSSCGHVTDNAMDILGRGTWSSTERGRRDLSIEIDGRDGRRKRHLSGDSGATRNSSLHCYIVPLESGSAPPLPTSTYREAFRYPSGQTKNRNAQSAPSTPLSSTTSSSLSSPSSSFSSSSSFRSSPSPALARNNGGLARPHRNATSFQNGITGSGSLNTTYREHFTWFS